MPELSIVSELVGLGFHGILLYLLFVVWNRLTVVTDKLISLREKVEAFESFMVYRTKVTKDGIEAYTDDRE